MPVDPRIPSGGSDIERLLARVGTLERQQRNIHRQVLTIFMDYTVTTPQATIDTLTVLGGDIPQTANHLEVILEVETTVASSADNIYFRLNNDSGAVYQYNGTRSNNGVITSVNGFGQTNGYAGVCAGASFAGWGSSTRLWFPCYRSTRSKGWELSGGFASNNGAASWQDNQSGSWSYVNSLFPITRISFQIGAGPNFAAGSRIVIRGS